jgi:hypothetical protein
MKKQSYIVTLEVPAPYDRRFPEIEAERMATIIRGGIMAKSCSFVGPVPFTIRCEVTGDSATALGHLKEYSTEVFEEPSPVVSQLVNTRSS